MFDIFIYFILKYIYLFSVVLFLIKIYLFVKNRNKNWTIAHFLYFNPNTIHYSSNEVRAKLKRIQNHLSFAIIIILVVQIILYKLAN